jgi:hypothetical protein
MSYELIQIPIGSKLMKTPVMKTLKIWMAFSAALVLATPAHALFRCGNSYQDKPCTTAAAESTVNPAIRNATVPTTPSTAKPAASPFAAACARMGNEAQRIVWNREAGATREKQIAELPRGHAYDEMVQTIDAVYTKRGTAPEIRGQIEAECLVQKQKQADAAAALKALAEQADPKAKSK